MIVRRLLTDMLRELRRVIFQISYSELMLWFALIVAISLLSATTPHASAKPLAFSFPPRFSLDMLRAVSGQATQERKYTAGVKPYTGLRISNETLRMIYWYDQTVAVVELGPKKLLLNCELIEIFDDADGQLLLRQLSRINRPLEISFDQMLKLMSQCQQVRGVGRVQNSQNAALASDGEDPQTAASGSADPRSQLDQLDAEKSNNILKASPFSLFSGIIPGTKWCGTGDIAQNYYELGSDRTMDRCCRTHDLCPVKVRGFSQRYNLTNASLYSKSHCRCDDQLFSCLKTTNTPAAQIMGNIYFNLVAVACLEDLPDGKRTFREAKKGF